MKESAIFLNMGRGDAVESDVIIKAIKEKEIAHAVLDVFETEPLPEDHPLWAEEKVTITPHLSGISPNYLPRDRKSTRLNSSYVSISYAVFCLKKKKRIKNDSYGS